MTNYVKKQVELITEGKCVVEVNENITHDLNNPTKVLVIETIKINDWSKVNGTSRVLLDLNFRGCNVEIENNICTITRRVLRDDNNLQDLTQRAIKKLV